MLTILYYMNILPMVVSLHSGVTVLIKYNTF